MAEAARARGLRYIAITDHSKNLAMTNGLDDKRALAHVKSIRKVDAEFAEEFAAGNKSSATPSSLLPTPSPFRVLPGIEVDILADGTLDLDDSTLAQMDIVVASVHSHFNQSIEEMTTRVLRALENPYVRILGHPTGRKVLGREGYAINIDLILKRAAELGVAVEHNASPARADLNDLNLRLAKQYGCRIVVDTDAHATEELDQMRYGITQLRRAGLTPADILNTEPTAETLLQNLRPRRG
jgi:DNA polymerase (family 10)